MPAPQNPQTNYRYAAPPKTKLGAAAIIGFIFVFMGGVYLISALSSGLHYADGTPAPASAGLPGLILFWGIGGTLVWAGSKNKRRHAQYTKYSAVIAGSPDIPLAQISSGLSKPLGLVQHDLKKLVSLGFFPGYYIDLSRKTFSCPAAKDRQPASPAAPPAQAAPHTPAAPSSAPPAAPKVLRCPNCGGTTTPGGGSECEYCGSPLG